jgi:hypothetical protein
MKIDERELNPYQTQSRADETESKSGETEWETR